MCATFDKHFRQPGDPYPEIISVPREEFYGKGYEDCDRRIPDVTKARKLLGWRSKHDLDSVLYHTMKYFVEKHRAKQPVAAYETGKAGALTSRGTERKLSHSY